ncbi:AAA domain-containing protein [Nocardia sp. NPDC050413]|uniref:AAA domain-containing protein n=1 Tax=Nocardia sp. NPDC050413 TaxID=3155784 RepID=UPI0033DAE38E
MSGTIRPYPISELLDAVRLEIAAELRSDGGDSPKISLSSGVLVSSSADRVEYLYACMKWDVSLDGSPVLVRPSRSSDPWTPAEVSRFPDGKVRVVVSRSIAGRTSNLQLRKDDSAILTALAQRIESVAADEKIRVDSAGWVLGLGRPHLGYESDPARWVSNWETLRLNARQRTAVAHALSSEVTFLWGPPGTGKTDVVGHIVEGNFRQGHNVLFLAPTRVAVDQALERICDLLVDEPGFVDGMVQRGGDIESKTLRERFGSSIDIEQITVRVAADLDAKFDQTSAALAKAQDEVHLYAAEAAWRESLAQAREDSAMAAAAQSEAERTVDQTRLEVDALQSALAHVGSPSGLFANRQAARVERLRRQCADVEGRRQQAARDAHNAKARVTAAAETIKAAHRELAVLEPKLRGVAPLPVLQRHAEQLRTEVDRLRRERDDIRRTVRRRCRVMGTTVAKAVQSRSLLERVDVVVIDEAGMVDLPSAWLVAGLAQKRIVIAGDFRQLPAVTKGAGDSKATDTDRAHSRKWCARDPFRAAELVDDSGTVRQDDRLVALDTQYRMREPICALVNAVAYPDAPLKTGRGDGSSIPANSLVDTAMLLIDTSRQRIPGPDNKANTVNEAVVHELIRGLQYEGVLPGRKWQSAEIPAGAQAVDRLAVIAPYRAQVKALQGSLKYRFGAEYEGLVDTIHRFQGSQRPVVIFDTAVGAGKDLGYFYRETGLSSQTCRLLNVALSRAQDHLIVVADLDHLRKHLPPRSEAGAMIDYLEAHAQVLSADQFVPIRDAAQLSELSEEELSRPAFFPADEVPKAVAWDIARAARSIEIYCPFLDPEPVRKWSKLLDERIRAGVRVVVSTRGTDEQRDDRAANRHRALIGELRAVGCEVDFRERMHEKVLIIDGSVLWHGSLNLLANLGPTDLMMRFTDPASCERVNRVIDRARKDRAARNMYAPASDRVEAAPTVRANGSPSMQRPEPGVILNGRLYLSVPFADKDEAKRQLHARWDGENKLWHVDASEVTRDQAQRWLPPAP